MLQPKSWHKLNLVPPIFFMLGIFLNLATTNPANAAEASQFFPETGKTVSGKFLQYWRENGGLPVYGYPITEAQPEVDPETGKTFLTQWFERNRFELHPENAGTKYEILLGLLGKDLKREALLADQAFVRATSLSESANLSDQQTYFNETGHNLQGLFYKYWRENGGLERFGYPISELHTATDPETGSTFLTQWFERARFEYHPDNEPPYNVLLGLLGKQLKSPPKISELVWSVGINPHSVYFPHNLAVDSNGNIYVADEHNRLLKYNRNRRLVNILDQFNNRVYVREIRVDSKNNVYFLKDKTLVKYAPDGRFLQEFNRNEGSFLYIVTDFAIDSNGAFYIASNNRVKKTDSNGKTLLEWTIPELAETSGRIEAIALDTQNNVYLAEGKTNSILKFDSQGKLLTSFKLDTSFPVRDTRLHVTKQGNIYVSTYSRHTISKIDSAGNKTTIQLSYDVDDFALDEQDNIYSTDAFTGIYRRTPQNEVTRWGFSDNDIIQYHAIYHDARKDGLISDKDGNLYLADYYTSTIKKFNNKGQLLASWGKEGENPGEFSFRKSRAVSLGIDAAGFLYIADSNRIQKFTNNGQFVEIWGQNEPESNRIRETQALAVDPKGYVYLAKDSSIFKYDLTGKFLASWDTKEQPLAGSLERLTVDGQGNIYALLTYNIPGALDNPRIGVQKYDFTGRFLLSFNAGSYLSSTSNYPLNATGISVDTQGNVYVSRDDYEYSPTTGISKYSPEGKKFMFIAGFFGITLDAVRPSAITVSNDDALYIFDRHLGLQKVRVPSNFIPVSD